MNASDPPSAREAVIFDFDGVLADTERLHLAAFQDVFASHDWTLDEAEYFARYLGYDDRDLVGAFARDRGLEVGADQTTALLREKAQRFSTRLAAGDALFPAAVPCVARLGEVYRLAIASGSLHEEIETILTGANLTAAFEAIVGADDVARSKPAPDSYQAAVTRLGVAPEAAVAIEDSRWGLDSARAAGLGTIAVTTSYPRDALGDADTVVDSLDQVTVDLVRKVMTR